MGTRWDHLYGRKDIYPKQQNLRERILWENHDFIDVSYPEQQRMIVTINASWKMHG